MADQQSGSTGHGPPLASLSLSSARVLSTPQANAGTRPVPISRTIPAGRHVPPTPQTPQPQPAPVAATGPSSTPTTAATTQHQRGRRAWRLPLVAGLGMFQLLRTAASHVLTRGPAPPRTVRPTSDRRVFPSLLAAGAGPGHSGRPGVPAGRKPALLWFRNDLRLHDHEPLSLANADATSVVPVYCFDPREYGKSPSGFDKTGPYRARFILEALADLRQRLRDAGSDLIVRMGKPEEVLPQLAAAVGAGAVYCHGEVTREEQQVEAAVAAALDRLGAKLVACWGGTLYHKDDLPFQPRDMPVSYGEFRQRVGSLAVRAPLALPNSVKGLPAGSQLDAGELPSLQQLGLSAAALQRSAADASAAGAQLKGGESQGLAHLQAFLAEQRGQTGTAAGAAGSVVQGASSSSGGGNSADAGGGSFNCRISPWLAMGCLSPREMYHQLLKQAGTPPPQQQQGSGKPGGKLGKGTRPETLGRGGPGGTGGGDGAWGEASWSWEDENGRAGTRQLMQPADLKLLNVASDSMGEEVLPLCDGAAGTDLSWLLFELMWRDFFRFITDRYASVGLTATSASAKGAHARAQPALAMA